MPWKVRGVGDSKACAVGTGSWQSSEGTSWAEVMPGGGLKLFRERMFGSEMGCSKFLASKQDLC